MGTGEENGSQEFIRVRLGKNAMDKLTPAERKEELARVRKQRAKPKPK